jgi:hypothetical protein
LWQRLRWRLCGGDWPNSYQFQPTVPSASSTSRDSDPFSTRRARDSVTTLAQPAHLRRVHTPAEGPSFSAVFSPLGLSGGKTYQGGSHGAFFVVEYTKTPTEKTGQPNPGAPRTVRMCIFEQRTCLARPVEGAP